MEQLARRHVAENRPRFGKLVERVDAPAGDDLAAEGAKPAGERIGDFLRAAAWNRPAHGMAGGAEDEGEARGQGIFERQHRVRRETGK